MERRRGGVVRPWKVGLLAIVAVASIGGSKRALGYARQLMHRGPPESDGMMEEDIQRFVSEGGRPLGAGAE